MEQPVPVRFLGMYDAVDMVLGYGTSESVPSNVQNTFHSMSNPKLHSRWYFNTADGGVVDAVKTNFSENEYWGTHSAIGGDPGNGDHPTGYLPLLETMSAIYADIDMREFATQVGVPINSTTEKDYEYLSIVPLPLPYDK